ncbi:MAG: DUF559 domain-containing protein [Ignavibacteriae bacterium]|nr:DUF559 domain-containing protein [Ignavibacteriota bacterium]
MFNYKIKLKKITKLPKTTMTGAEIILWSKLRIKQNGDNQFFRQKRIGNYRVDFYCPTSKLVIILDGGQINSEEKRAKDKAMDRYFKKMGYKVLRFQNSDVRRKIRNVMGEINRNVINFPNLGVKQGF